MTTTRTIDASRYRVAESIVGRWEAGDSIEQIDEDYLTDLDHPLWWNPRLVVELIVAAADRKGRYEPK